MLAADSVYRSVRLLPNKLKYDYERKKISEGIKKNEIESRRQNLLSDGDDEYDDEIDDLSGVKRDGRGKRRGGRIPLLPDTIYGQGGTSDKSKRNSYDEYDDVIDYDNKGSNSYNTVDSIDDNNSGRDSDGCKQQEQRMTMIITQEDATASATLIQALRAFSRDVIESGELMTLKKELSWAVGVAQETLDLEILEAGKMSRNRGKIHFSYCY